MKTSRKRVVITGLGILSSLAENIQDFREALLNKKNGVADSERFAKWFENARAAEVLHDIEYSDLNEDVIDSLDNAALWAYKVGKDALSQAGLMDSRDTLKETGMIVGVSSACQRSGAGHEQGNGKCGRNPGANRLRQRARYGYRSQ